MVNSGEFIVAVPEWQFVQVVPPLMPQAFVGGLLEEVKLYFAVSVAASTKIKVVNFFISKIYHKTTDIRDLNIEISQTNAVLIR